MVGWRDKGERERKPMYVCVFVRGCVGAWVRVCVDEKKEERLYVCV